MATLPKNIDIPVASVTNKMTVNINLTGLRRWHLRLQLGLALMRLAVWVLGMGFKVEDSELPPEKPSDTPPDASGDESFGGDAHLTDRGKEAIGTLRQMRANDDPRLRCYSVRKQAFVRCGHTHCRGRSINAR